MKRLETVLKKAYLEYLLNHTSKNDHATIRKMDILDLANYIMSINSTNPKAGLGVVTLDGLKKYKSQ